MESESEKNIKFFVVVVCLVCLQIVYLVLKKLKYSCYTFRSLIHFEFIFVYGVIAVLKYCVSEVL